MRRSALAPEASFRHAQNSWFQPPMRHKKGNSGREGPSNSISNHGKSFETPKAAKTAHGAPGSSKRNPPPSSKGQKRIQWDKDYSKMLEEIKNLDISDLRVVELTSGSGNTRNEDTNPKTSSVPLDVTGNAGGDEDVDGLPPGWRRLVSRSTGQTYFGNIFTGESTWTRPSGDILSSSAWQEVGGVVGPASSEQSVHTGPSAISTISLMPEAIQPQISANAAQQDHRRQGTAGECFDDTSHNVTIASLPSNPAAQSQYNAIISVDPRDQNKDDHIGVDMSAESFAIAAHPDSWEPTGPAFEQVLAVEQVLPTALERTVSILHLVVSLSFFVSTCTLLGLQAKWIREGKTPEGQRCSAGPPLLQWAVGMSAGLVIFATIIHVSLIRRDRVFSGGGKVSSGRSKWLLRAIFSANLIVFVLGQVWVFSTYPRAGVGCGTSWTLPHVEYATASFLIICIYLGYSVAAATLLLMGGATKAGRRSNSPQESDQQPWPRLPGAGEAGEPRRERPNLNIQIPPNISAQSGYAHAWMRARAHVRAESQTRRHICLHGWVVCLYNPFLTVTHYALLPQARKLTATWFSTTTHLHPGSSVATTSQP